MKRSFCALYLVTLVLPFVGCNASVEEEAPPSTAPVMTEEEKQRMEEMMKQSAPQGK